MKISDRGIAFIADWEGLRLKMYDDGGPGIGNATIGIGHLIHLGPIDGQASEAPFRNGITREQAYELFRVDVIRFEDVVKLRAKVPLNQNQFDALVDFSFNTGGGYPAVWQAVNSRADVARVLAVTAILPAWATAALKRRRIAEGALYNKAEQPPEEDEMKIAPWWTNRELAAGNGEINLFADFGPAKAYDIRIIMAPESKGAIRFGHGDLREAGVSADAGDPTASGLIIPNAQGKAPFTVVNSVKIAYLACAGTIE